MIAPANSTALFHPLQPAAIRRHARRRDAHVVALSFICPAADPAIGPELVRLRQGLGADVLMAVGGRACSSYTDAIGQVGGLTFEDLRALRALEDPRLLVRS